MSPDRTRRLLLLSLTTLALPALGQQAPRPKGAVTMDTARNLVMELPEVKKWQAARQKIADDTKGPSPTGGVLTGRRTLQGREHWAVTFYEDPQTQPKKWNTFLVRATDGRLFVEGDAGKLLTLDQWRKAAPAQ